MSSLRLREKIAALGKGVLFFFYPPKCAICGEVGYEGLCPDCEGRVQKAFQPQKYLANGGNGFADAMYCLFPYKDAAVKKLLFDWKRENFTDLPLIFRPYLEKAAKSLPLPSRIDLISYLPRRQSARKKAGFDQAEEIAKLFSEVVSIPFEPLLKRQGHSKPQRKAKYEKRESNIHGAFRAERRFQGETILLIDDIVTTGATAREGARILKGAGAQKVYILSLAH